jgi:predicted metal-binding protein
MHSKLKKTEAPVRESLILICEKCGKKLSDSDENPARNLQQRLKEEIKQTFGKGVVRAVLTTCMDICPLGEIAVGFARTGEANEFYTIEKKDVEGSLGEILEKARQ